MENNLIALLSRAVGICAMLLGFLGIFGLDDPKFENSLWLTATTALGAFALMWLGYWLFRQGGGESFIDRNTFKNLRG